MLGRLRAQFAPLKRALARPLILAGISPVAISLAGIPIAMLGGYLYVHGFIFWAVVWSTVASLTDFVDGEVARHRGQASPKGNYLEAMCDKVVENILLLALGTRFPAPAMFALTCGMLVSYAKPRVALVIVTDNRDWPGWADHSDRMLITIVSMAATAIPFTLGGTPVAAALLWLLASLALVGAFQRVRYGLSLIDEAQREDGLLPYIKAGQSEDGSSDR